MLPYPSAPDELIRLRSAIDHISFTFTNRCNLRCVYCPQGTHPDEFHADTSDAQLRKILAYIDEKQLSRVSIGYYGETMLVEGWEAYCRPLLDRGIYLTLVSNFSKIMTPSELDVVSRFSEIQISIDTVDPVLLKRARKSVDVRTILYNTQQIQAHAIAQGLPMPKLIWTGVLTDQVVMGMRDMVAMAIACGLKNINFNDVGYFESVKNATRNIYELPADAFIAAVEIIEEARSLATRHGVILQIWSDIHIEQRLLDEFGADEYARLTRRLSSLDRLSGGRRTYIYGAGEAGRALRKEIGRLSNIWFAGYIDSFASGSVEGEPILALEVYKAEARADDQILICSMHEEAIDGTLTRAGFTNQLKAYSFFKRNFRQPAKSGSMVEAVTRTGIQGKFAFAGDAFDSVPDGMTRMCDSPWTEIYFDPKGEAYSCCQRGTVMGMLTPEASIDDIMNNADYQDLRRQLLTGENLNSECRFCELKRSVTPEFMKGHVDELVAGGK